MLSKYASMSSVLLYFVSIIITCGFCDNVTISDIKDKNDTMIDLQKISNKTEQFSPTIQFVRKEPLTTVKQNKRKYSNLPEQFATERKTDFEPKIDPRYDNEYTTETGDGRSNETHEDSTNDVKSIYDAIAFPGPSSDEHNSDRQVNYQQNLDQQNNEENNEENNREPENHHNYKTEPVILLNNINRPSYGPPRPQSMHQTSEVQIVPLNQNDQKYFNTAIGAISAHLLTQQNNQPLHPYQQQVSPRPLQFEPKHPYPYYVYPPHLTADPNAFNPETSIIPIKQPQSYQQPVIVQQPAPQQPGPIYFNSERQPATIYITNNNKPPQIYKQHPPGAIVYNRQQPPVFINNRQPLYSQSPRFTNNQQTVYESFQTSGYRQGGQQPNNYLDGAYARANAAGYGPFNTRDNTITYQNPNTNQQNSEIYLGYSGAGGAGGGGSRQGPRFQFNNQQPHDKFTQQIIQTYLHNNNYRLYNGNNGDFWEMNPTFMAEVLPKMNTVTNNPLPHITIPEVGRNQGRSYKRYIMKHLSKLPTVQTYIVERKGEENADIKYIGKSELLKRKINDTFL